MQDLKGATSRRRAGFRAAIAVAVGVSGAVLLTPGTALAAPLSTTISFTVKPWVTLSPGLAGDEVDVSVTTGTGSAPAPTGSVVVAIGTTSCTVTLTAGSSDTSTGACLFDGTHAPGIPFGVYTVTATYTPSSSTSFSGSSASQSGVVIGSKPAWTADTPPLTASPGEDYDYTFQASGVPAPTYSLAAGAPTWLQINSTTGEVSGHVPWWIGSFSYSVTTTNSVGSISAGPFTVDVFFGGRHHHHGHADITTSLSCPSSVRSFGHGTCTLTVTNQGSATVDDVFAEIVLPSELRARYCMPGGGWFWGNGWNWGGGCRISDNAASLQIGDLGAGSSRQLSVTFRVVAQLFFGWWHSEKVTVEGIAGTNDHQWWWQRQQEIDSYSFATIRIWPSRQWW